MFIQTLLLISSLSFAADGSKYKGKTGREAHESIKEPSAENSSDGAPTRSEEHTSDSSHSQQSRMPSSA